MSSGVAVADACIEAFQDLKLKHSYAYIIYALAPSNAEIVVESTAPAGSSYDDFLAALPANECRYAIFDFQYEKPGEGKRSKICFFMWSPPEAKIRGKMLYASSKDALRKKLQGVAVEIQGTDMDEVSFDAVYEKASRGN